MRSLKKMGMFITGAVLALDLSASVVRSQDAASSGQSATPAENRNSSHRDTGISVRQAQQVLKDKGYYKADVDGKYGPETRAALQKYQQDENLTATGRLDHDTAARLAPGKKASGTAATTADAPIQGAKSAAKEGYTEAKDTATTAGKHETKQAGSAVKEGLGAVKGDSKTKKAPKRQQ